MLFEKFMKLLAGRAGQLLNHSSLANDVGVTVATIKNWLSILEASFIIFKLPPYFEDFGKRVVKSPKYYFIDTGLLCFLLGIEKPEQVARDPLVGQLFENLVVIEFLKSRTNRGYLPGLYFFRDSNGLEVDLIFQQGRQLTAIEVKSSSTYHPSMLKALKKLKLLAPTLKQTYLIFSGDKFEFTDGMSAVNFSDVDQIMAG